MNMRLVGPRRELFKDEVTKPLCENCGAE
jgi:GMP synthase PP-ATPase subunit